MRRRLPSGIRLGPPWPIRLLNAAGPLVKKLGLWPTLKPDELVEAAQRKCGASTLPAAHLRALPPRTHAFNNDARLSLFGALAVKGQFMRGLTNSLRFGQLIDEHPEILDEEIRRPLFIVGLPRTGTTLLHRLLSMHNDARFLPFWEAYAPLPKKPGAHQDGGDGRISDAKRTLALLKYIAPDLSKIHPMEAGDPEECFLIFRNYLLTPPGFDFGYFPSFWKWFDDEAHIDAYRLHKRQLQIHQWLGPRGHWGLKCPNHLSGLPQLREVYPDARIVYTHRDPEQVIASLCSLTALTWSMTSDDVDLDEVVEFAMNMAEQCQAAAESALASIPAEQILHVEFDDLVADPVKTALSIHERFGYPRDPDLKAKLKSWLENNRSDKHGSHSYALSDFGLTVEDVRKRLKGAEIKAAPAAS